MYLYVVTVGKERRMGWNLKRQHPWLEVPCMVTHIARIWINRVRLPILHGQLNRENEYFPVRVRPWEFGLARRARQSRPASACSSPYLRLNLVLTYGIRPEFRGGVHLFMKSTVHLLPACSRRWTPSERAIAQPGKLETDGGLDYRWTPSRKAGRSESMYAPDCSVKDVGWDCRTCPARPNYLARTGTEKLTFVFNLPRAYACSRIEKRNLCTRLMP